MKPLSRRTLGREGFPLSERKRSTDRPPGPEGSCSPRERVRNSEGTNTDVIPLSARACEVTSPTAATLGRPTHGTGRRSVFILLAKDLTPVADVKTTQS